MCKGYCKRWLVLIIACSFIQILSAQTAQNGRITGKILNVKNEALVGVSVSIDGKKQAAISDIEGYFKLSVAANKPHTLVFSFVGYNNKTVTDVKVLPGKTEVLDLVLDEANNELDKVVVTSAAARRETAASLLAFQKNNISVSDGISAESIKRSPDNNVGEVLKRVTGASVQDEKFVIVRGLSDRYNVVTINGAVMPSTEPDRRTFSFDVIPSGMIDNLMINKTATPDMPGEFAGGIIQITTKDIPSTNTTGINVGAGYNSISTGKDFRFSRIEGLDYLGFDNTRGMPSAFPSSVAAYRNLNMDGKLAASRTLKNSFGVRYNGTALPAFNGQFNIARKIDLEKGGSIGIIGAVNYRNTQNIEFTDRYQYNNTRDDSDPYFLYRDSSYHFETTVGGLLNIGYKKGSNKIVFKNIYNRVFENEFTMREGENRENSQYVQNQISQLVQKSMLTSQLEGEHASGKNKYKWNLNFANTRRDMPDYHSQPYQKNLSTIDDKTVPFELNTRNTYRFFSKLNEYSYGAKFDYNRPVNFIAKNSQFKAGVLAQMKQRDFNNRQLRIEPASGSFNTDLLKLPAKQIFAKANFSQEGFFWDEITNFQDTYDANSNLYAAYLMLDNKLSEKIRLIWGVRAEQFGYKVNTRDISGSKEKIDESYIDILPSVNAIYSVNTKSNIRFSASRTVSRPEFREVARFSYFDMVENALIYGNPDLKRGQITNLDLRYEVYPTSGEIISASVFYKYFNTPIEQYLGSASGALRQISFENSKYATNYGIELDLRKKLSFINSTSSFLENLYITANAALIKSKVNSEGLDLSSYDNNRPLQGQSPYLINVGLSYQDVKGFMGATVLFNRAGARIDAVGGQGIPDFYENGRNMLDAQLSFKLLKKKAELKLNASNILNQKTIFYQNLDGGIEKRSFNKNSDRITQSTLQGVAVSASFAYTF